MPAISKFEDRLKDFHTQQSKANKMLRRFDEILCTKVDKVFLKEVRADMDNQYATKASQKTSEDLVNTSIKTFSEKMQELDNIVKFQTRQI